MGCFNVDKNNKIDEDNIMYRKSLILESILTSPEGQFVKFDKDMPVFMDGDINKKKIKYLNKIFDGILTGMENLSCNLKDISINPITIGIIEINDTVLGFIFNFKKGTVST